jgi:uncharacterized membrane protein
MVLSFHSTLQTVFLIFGIFWVVVILVLLVGVGMLLKKHDRLLEKHHHGDSSGAH